jgi:hypothetical protein
MNTAIIVAVVSVVAGDRTTTLYAPRVITTFFLGSLVFALSCVCSGVLVISCQITLGRALPCAALPLYSRQAVPTPIRAVSAPWAFSATISDVAIFAL